MKYNTCDPTYFEKLQSGEIKMYSINGIIYGARNIICDICCGNIISDFDNYYIYCFDCKSNICKKCFTNNDSEYDECEHIKHVERAYYISDEYVCDLCYKNDDEFYSKVISDKDFISVNICENCSETPNGQYFIFLFNLIKIKQIKNDPLIGNIYDWLPIFKTYDGYLLINTNEKSEYYNQLATICLHNNLYYFHSYHDLNDNNLLNISQVIEFVGVETFMRSMSIKFHNFMSLW